MARRSSWIRRGWGPRIVAGVFALALVGMPSAVVAKAPGSSDQPSTAQLTATIEDFLADRATHITGETKAARGQALGRTKAFSSLSDGLFVVLDGRRAAIRENRIEYTRPEIEVTIASVDRTDQVLTVAASELTKLYFRKVKGDEPDYTAYREDHVFTFKQTAGTWALADQRPADNSSIAPVTEAIGMVATGDPLAVDPGSSWIDRPAGKLPTVDKQEATLPHGAVTPMAIPPGLSYTAMVNYAVKFWKNYNPAYRTFAGNGGDCTNFISQILREGGWAFKTGLWTDDNNWWYNALNQTHSWAGAENWSHFAPQRTTALTNIWQMTIADILQFDFNKDGIMDHSMVVTKKTTSEIYMTYHSTNTLNRPLSELQAKYANSAWWYSYRT